MKTPMQELISAIRKRQEDEDVQPFMWHEQIVELAESMIEKEKEQMCEFADEFSRECIDFHHAQTMSPDRFFELTFNTKER